MDTLQNITSHDHNQWGVAIPLYAHDVNDCIITPILPNMGIMSSWIGMYSKYFYTTVVGANTSEMTYFGTPNSGDMMDGCQDGSSATYHLQEVT